MEPSIRGRLTSMYAAAMVVLLAAYGVGVYWFVQNTLFEDLDDQLRSDGEYAEDVLEWSADGAALELRGAPQEAAAADRWLQVWSPDGRLVHQTAAAAQEPIDGLGAPHVRTAVSTRERSGERVRVLDRRAGVQGRPVFVRTAREEESLRSEIARIEVMLALGLGVGVLIASAAGHELARRALAPVDRMADRANAITADRLSDRLPVEREDELGRLATAFNAALTRLEQSFHQMRQFTSDVSHELRTPLTAVRSVGEVGLQSPRSPQAYREIIGSMLEEVDRLGGLVNTLLVLSRVDAGQTTLDRRRFDLASLVHETIKHVQVLAEDKEQDLVCNLAPSVIVYADSLLLRQAIINVVDNAIKYSAQGTPIQIGLAAENGHAWVTIRDAGPGIASADQPHIFDRFYRADHGRSREIGGAGLGLAIARSVVEAHGGQITLNSKEGEGSTFRIDLPTAE
jgi:heavy metal sensor kinase